MMKVICKKTSTNFTKGKTYKAKRIFAEWPWMIMAWDNFDIGRYIHNDDYGTFIIQEDA